MYGNHNTINSARDRPTSSGAPVAEPGPNSIAFQNELEVYMHLITLSLSASNSRLQEYRNKQKEDQECSLIRGYCTTEWPDAADVPLNLNPYSEVGLSLLCWHNFENNRLQTW